MTRLTSIRVRALKHDIPPKIASEAAEKSGQILKHFETIAPELQGINAWRYQRQISGGLQEFMEAISFQHYLRTQTLITLSEASQFTAGIELTSDDYLLGIFDLVGELMRFAITTMATTGSLPSSTAESGEEQTILVDLRRLRAHFEELDTSSCGGTPLGRDFDKKMEVMKTCVEKVETAVYGMIVRGRERPKGWVPDLDGGDRAAVESY